MASRKKQHGAADPSFQPKQQRLFELLGKSEATWIGYGGSRGAAKSGAIDRCALALAGLLPKVRILIFRRTFQEVYKNHIEKIFSDWPVLRQYYNTQTKTLRIPHADGRDATITFGYAEHEADIKAFQGQEYRYIFIDEATSLTQAEMEFLKTCNRAPNTPEHKCKMVLTMNPGGIGHSFVKRIFYDKKYAANERPEQYAFIQAYGWDNVEWVKPALKREGLKPEDYYERFDEQTRFQWFIERSDYGRSLNALPESMRVGHLLGRWDIFAGQYFDVFNAAVHTARRETYHVEPWHSKWVSIDWGFAHPAAIYWFAQDGPLTRCYREALTRGVGPKELAAAIVNATLQNEKIEAVYLSPDAFAKRTDSDTIAQQMTQVFADAGWPECSPADDDRVGGWALVYEMLKRGELLIDSSCDNIIETLPKMARDAPKRPEDCIKFNASEGKYDGDDSADSFRYGLKSRIASHGQPTNVQVDNKIAALKQAGYLSDPTLEMIKRRELEWKSKKSAQPVKFAYRRGGSSSGRRPSPRPF